MKAKRKSQVVPSKKRVGIVHKITKAKVQSNCTQWAAPGTLRERVRKIDLAPTKLSAAMELLWPRAKIEKGANELLDKLELMASGTLSVCTLSPAADELLHRWIYLNTQQYRRDCESVLGRGHYFEHDAWTGDFGSRSAQEQKARFRKTQRALAGFQRKVK